LKKIIVGIVAFVFSSTQISAQDQMQHIKKEMSRHNVETVYIGGGGGVDEYPAWSKDGRYLALNLMGDWIGVDLENVVLNTADWKGIVVGALAETKQIQLGTIDGYIETRKENMRAITLSNGDEYKFVGSLGKSLTKTIKGAEPEVVWQGDFENCFGFNASPDENFLAFICEQNGLFVMGTGEN
jgi:hypothetical protein